jgi:hypothetical protein
MTIEEILKGEEDKEDEEQFEPRTDNTLPTDPPPFDEWLTWLKAPCSFESKLPRGLEDEDSDVLPEDGVDSIRSPGLAPEEDEFEVEGDESAWPVVDEADMRITFCFSYSVLLSFPTCHVGQTSLRCNMVSGLCWTFFWCSLHFGAISSFTIGVNLVILVPSLFSDFSSFASYLLRFSSVSFFFHVR